MQNQSVALLEMGHASSSHRSFNAAGPLPLIRLADSSMSSSSCFRSCVCPQLGSTHFFVPVQYTRTLLGLSKSVQGGLLESSEDMDLNNYQQARVRDV